MSFFDTEPDLKYSSSNFNNSGTSFFGDGIILPIPTYAVGYSAESHQLPDLAGLEFGEYSEPSVNLQVRSNRLTSRVIEGHVLTVVFWRAGIGFGGARLHRHGANQERSVGPVGLRRRSQAAQQRRLLEPRPLRRPQRPVRRARDARLGLPVERQSAVFVLDVAPQLQRPTGAAVVDVDDDRLQTEASGQGQRRVPTAARAEQQSGEEVAREGQGRRATRQGEGLAVVARERRPREAGETARPEGARHARILCSHQTRNSRRDAHQDRSLLRHHQLMLLLLLLFLIIITITTTTTTTTSTTITLLYKPPFRSLCSLVTCHVCPFIPPLEPSRSERFSRTAAAVHHRQTTNNPVVTTTKYKIFNCLVTTRLCCHSFAGSQYSWMVIWRPWPLVIPKLGSDDHWLDSSISTSRSLICVSADRRTD